MPAHSSRLIFMLCFVSLSLSLATFIVPTQKHLSNLLTQITTAEKTFCSAPLSKTFFIA